MTTTEAMSRERLDRYILEAAKTAASERGFGVRGCDLGLKSWWVAYTRQSTREQADQYQTWWQSKSDLPLEFGFRGHGGFRGCPGPWTMQNTNSNIASNTNVSTY